MNTPTSLISYLGLLAIWNQAASIKSDSHNGQHECAAHRVGENRTGQMGRRQRRGGQVGRPVLCSCQFAYLRLNSISSVTQVSIGWPLLVAALNRISYAARIASSSNPSGSPERMRTDFTLPSVPTSTLALTTP